jgi:hypothetical protein
VPKRGGERYKAATETETNKPREQESEPYTVSYVYMVNLKRKVGIYGFGPICMYTLFVYIRMSVGQRPAGFCWPEPDNTLESFPHVIMRVPIEFPMSSHEFLWFS